MGIERLCRNPNSANPKLHQETIFKRHVHMHMLVSPSYEDAPVTPPAQTVEAESSSMQEEGAIRKVGMTGPGSEDPVAGWRKSRSETGGRRRCAPARDLRQRDYLLLGDSFTS